LYGLPGATASNRVVVLAFSLDELRYALPLSVVERVIRAVETTPLPKAPKIVLGVINAKGAIIPVMDVRSRFRLPLKGIDCNDRFILARTPARVVALAVDAVSGILELDGDRIASAEASLPFAEYLHGVAALDDGLVLINDLDRFLSLDEADELDAALARGAE
jgi:purine-binding chemotaxis protein CheW